jgi:hypothetical protein
MTMYCARRPDAKAGIPGTAEIFDPGHVLKPGSQPSGGASRVGRNALLHPVNRAAGFRGSISIWCLTVVGLLSWLG